MKRSEMIYRIAGLLSTHKELEKDHPSAFVGFAAEVLTLIEEAGMLPPFNEKINAKDIISLRMDPYDSENYFVWELEDE